MDGAGDDWIGWTADGLAAGILGAAVGTCLLWLGFPQLAIMAASSAVLGGLTLLRWVKPEPRRFRLPAFDTEAAFEGPQVLDLTEVFVPEQAPIGDLAAEDDDALLLEDRLEEPEPDSRVVQLFAHRPLPTPGELQQRIEAHLSAPRPPLDLGVDASAALRQALGELRRSLG